jgi:hypothetical protein
VRTGNLAWDRDFRQQPVEQRFGLSRGLFKPGSERYVDTLIRHAAEPEMKHADCASC